MKNYRPKRSFQLTLETCMSEDCVTTMPHPVVPLAHLRHQAQTSKKGKGRAIHYSILTSILSASSFHGGWKTTNTYKNEPQQQQTLEHPLSIPSFPCTLST